MGAIASDAGGIPPPKEGVKSIQTGQMIFSSSEQVETATITAIDQNKSVVIIQGYSANLPSNANVDDLAKHCFFRVRFSSDTVVEGRRSSSGSGSSATLRYSVLEFY